MQNILKKIFYLNSDEKEIYPLYTLRFIFFIFIFVEHCYDNIQIPMLRQPALAVSGFILLSGFLNGYIYINKDFKVNEVFSFTYKRIKKFYPLYIMVLLLTIPVFEAFNISIKAQFVIFIKKLLCNILLIQSWINNPEFYFSFNGVSWFLSTYLFLSFVTLPIIHFLKKINNKKHKNIILISLAIFLFIITLFIVRIINEKGFNDRFCEFWIYVFPPSRLFEYIIGIIFGIISSNIKISFKDDIIVFSILEMVSLIITIIFIYKIPNINYIFNIRFNAWIIPVTLILVVFSFKIGIISKLFSMKLLVFLGKISMYMFIVHPPLIAYITKSVGKVVHYRYLRLYTLLITILISYLINKYEINKKKNI